MRKRQQPATLPANLRYSSGIPLQPRQHALAQLQHALQASARISGRHTNQTNSGTACSNASATRMQQRQQLGAARKPSWNY
jgi:hypothetical protein